MTIKQLGAKEQFALLNELRVKRGLTALKAWKKSTKDLEDAVRKLLVDAGPPIVSVDATSGRLCEDWFTDAAERLRPRFEKLQLHVPKKLFVTVGFPSTRMAVAQCWYPHAHDDGETTSIFVSPIHKTPVQCLDSLMHELVHASLPRAGHRKPFVEACNQLGLTEGTPKSRGAHAALLAELAELAQSLGPVRYAQIVTRKFKIVAPAEVGEGDGEGGEEGEEGEGDDDPGRQPWRTFISPENKDYSVRMGPKAWEAVKKPPVCPLSGKPMLTKTK